MDLMIIHGYELHSGGSLSEILMRRLHVGLQTLKNRCQISNVILTGGSARNGFIEAAQMFNYFKLKQVSASIKMETESKNTVENVNNCRKMILSQDFNKVYVVLGKNMLVRTKMIYKYIWPDIFHKIKWLIVEDGYQGHLELMWYLTSVMYIMKLKFR